VLRLPALGLCTEARVSTTALDSAEEHMQSQAHQERLNSRLGPEVAKVGTIAFLSPKDFVIAH